MITKFKIFEQHENIDPYNEEIWDTNLQDFKEGDEVMCINNTGDFTWLKYLELNKIYKIVDIGIDGEHITLSGIIGWFMKNRFVKI